MDTSLKKPIVIYKSLWFKLNPLMWRYAGQTLYPIIWFKRSREEVGDVLFRHELEHWYQIREVGYLKYYAKYLWLLIRKGYRNHPLEIEAREASRIPLTEEERKWKDG